jgi:hypothetical protein
MDKKPFSTEHRGRNRSDRRWHVRGRRSLAAVIVMVPMVMSGILVAWHFGANKTVYGHSAGTTRSHSRSRANDINPGKGAGNAVIDVARPPGNARAEKESDVSAEADRSSGYPGDAVTVTISSGDSGAVLDDCTVGFRGQSKEDCSPSEDATETSETLQVPEMPPGDTWIDWSTAYFPDFDDDLDVHSVNAVKTELFDKASGSIPFTVLAPDPGITASATPTSGAPGSTVTISFSSADEDVVIVGCRAWFDKPGSSGCTGETEKSLVLHVPTGAPGSRPIGWAASYRLSEGDIKDAHGTATFSVLPVGGTTRPNSSTPPKDGGGLTAVSSRHPSAGQVSPPPQNPQETNSPLPPAGREGVEQTRRNSLLPYGVPVGAVILAALIIGALLIRRKRSRGRAEAEELATQQEVRAEQRPGSEVKVTTRHRGPTVAVRLEPRTNTVAVRFQEVIK